MSMQYELEARITGVDGLEPLSDEEAAGTQGGIAWFGVAAGALLMAAGDYLRNSRTYIQDAWNAMSDHCAETGCIPVS